MRAVSGGSQLGVCCAGSLDSNSVCCQSEMFDECGMCDGDNGSCGTSGVLSTQVVFDTDTV